MKAEQSGFTLIEVLVALFIVSLGLLGMAGLQVVSLKQNQSAYLRTQAGILAYDIVDRMRANPTAVSGGDYFGATGTERASCETTAGCTDSQMALHDLFRWQQQLAQELPQGDGRVCRDANPDDTVDGNLTTPACGDASDAELPIIVYVWWNDERTTGNISTRFAVSVSL